MVARFDGEYRFLSNFWPCEIEFDGLVFPSVEHAFVAAKTLNLEERRIIQSLSSPGEAKKYGRQLQLRSDWEAVKEEQMLYFLRLKFSRDPLRSQLRDTDSEELVEGNTWHDNFWGSCTCSRCGNQGQNILGKLLMRVREEIRSKVIARLTRGQINKKPGLDTTVKSAQGMAKYFAPTWEMVLGHKNGTVSDEQYTAAYQSLLNQVPKEAWAWLRTQVVDGELCFLCYCRDEWFCHTHLLIDYILTRWGKHFEDGRK